MSDDGASSARPRRHPVGRVLAALGWLVVAALVGFLAVRVLAYDTRRVTIAANAYTPYVFAAVVPVLAFAALTRRRALILASAVLLMVGVLFVAPRLGAQDVPGSAAGAPRLRVVTANVANQNPERDVLARELLAADADVLAVVELTGDWGDALIAAGIDDEYPHQVEFVQRGTQGIGIYSRLPLRRGEIDRDLGRPTARADVRVGDRWVHVVAAHPPPPHHDRRALHTQLGALRDLADAHDGPLVVMGDMNSTLWNKGLRELVGGSLRSAHDARGRSLWATTWPNGTRRALPALIDHVLVTDHFAVLAVTEGDGTGSDHRPVIADLALLDRAEDG